MINYLDEISKLVTNIKPYVHIEIIDKLYYSKYAFCASSKLDRFNRNLENHAFRSTDRLNIISATKHNVKLLESVYGKNWKNVKISILTKNTNQKSFQNLSKIWNFCKI